MELAGVAELKADFDNYQHLLPGRELSRRLSEDGQHILVSVSVSDAPERAAVMSPWFTLSGDRIDLGGIDYYDAAGHRIT